MNHVRKFTYTDIANDTLTIERSRRESDCLVVKIQSGQNCGFVYLTPTQAHEAALVLLREGFVTTSDFTKDLGLKCVCTHSKELKRLYALAAEKEISPEILLLEKEIAERQARIAELKGEA